MWGLDYKWRTGGTFKVGVGNMSRIVTIVDMEPKVFFFGNEPCPGLACGHIGLILTVFFIAVSHVYT